MKPSKSTKKTSKKPGGGPVKSEVENPAPPKTAPKAGKAPEPVKKATLPVIAEKAKAPEPAAPIAAAPERNAQQAVAKKKPVKAATKAAGAAKMEGVKPAAPESKASNLTTTIEVNMDAGFGNSLFIRGEGAGLSWDNGLLMECINSNTWRWSVKTKETLSFKVLLNDLVWSHGDDLVVSPGEKLVVTPQFFQ